MRERGITFTGGTPFCVPAMRGGSSPGVYTNPAAGVAGQAITPLAEHCRRWFLAQETLPKK